MVDGVLQSHDFKGGELLVGLQKTLEIIEDNLPIDELQAIVFWGLLSGFVEQIFLKRLV